jgi:hypothetical protein
MVTKVADGAVGAHAYEVHTPKLLEEVREEGGAGREGQGGRAGGRGRGKGESGRGRGRGEGQWRAGGAGRGRGEGQEEEGGRQFGPSALEEKGVVCSLLLFHHCLTRWLMHSLIYSF